MATTAQELRVLSASELDEVLDQARAENWRELALIELSGA
jgi:ribosomal protein L29